MKLRSNSVSVVNGRKKSTGTASTADSRNRRLEIRWKSMATGSSGRVVSSMPPSDRR
ncbi:hypothetical protein D3C80_1953870 [compost metagenome]